ncbi:uncharacterized protein LOC127122068 [Lathyrus oleraceus]|uniref:uncharacterized protein LOC127122068 n=1 Tax=Pisum sativum TaxID=3888 RepID=UPI0021D1E527|nr:uncharacterized protein LOC127122068 [Pisum sativum]
MEYERDINVISHGGNLKKVQETKGYYDPLQYPILFLFETHSWDINTINCIGRKESCRAYYSYMLQIRPNDQSMLLNAGRLRWIKEHQSDIHVELYQGLQDVMHVGETNAENIGKRTILPSSFIGGRRDMTQRYEDGMAIVLNGSKPDIFLTITCNPSWSEITSEPFPFQTPQDHPDLLTRIFCSRFEKLKDDVINKGVLGKVKSYMYLKQFLDETRQGTDSYPEYRRRFDESILLGRDMYVDNRWVCSSIKSIKYMFKYVYKGHDHVTMEVHKGSHMDEVK